MGNVSRSRGADRNPERVAGDLYNRPLPSKAAVAAEAGPGL